MLHVAQYENFTVAQVKSWTPVDKTFKAYYLLKFNVRVLYCTAEIKFVDERVFKLCKTLKRLNILKLHANIECHHVWTPFVIRCFFYKKTFCLYR